MSSQPGEVGCKINAGRSRTTLTPGPSHLKGVEQRL
jgi:hypothetical protein